MCHLLLNETRDPNSPTDMQREMRHTFGWTYNILPDLLEILQLSFFLHNSNFFRQPSSLRVQRSRAAKLEILFVRTTGGTFAETQEKSLGDRALS
jgi:hypothetical protein